MIKHFVFQTDLTHHSPNPQLPAMFPLVVLWLALPLVSSLVTLLDPRVLEKISSNPGLQSGDKQHLVTLLQELAGAYNTNKGMDWRGLFTVGRRQGEKARRERKERARRKQQKEKSVVKSTERQEEVLYLETDSVEDKSVQVLKNTKQKEMTL